MNHKIIESIITTKNADGSPHIAPMGIWEADGHMVLAPFKPSRTLNNLERDGVVTVNFTDQVKVFAGCLTGHHDWEVLPAKVIDGLYLDVALTHTELQVSRVVDHELRPEYHCQVLHRETHGSFNGFNRAQAAVVELAILVSRLQLLSAEKIDNELAYLAIAIDKTAGEDEREAWEWLIQKVSDFRQAQGD